MAEPREEVTWFAEHMERKLCENDGKGGWRNCHLEWLLRRLRTETTELRKAIEAYESDTSTAPAIIAEAADVANYAMFIAEEVRDSPW